MTKLSIPYNSQKFPFPSLRSYARTLWYRTIFQKVSTLRKCQPAFLQPPPMALPPLRSIQIKAPSPDHVFSISTIMIKQLLQTTLLNPFFTFNNHISMPGLLHITRNSHLPISADHIFLPRTSSSTITFFSSQRNCFKCGTLWEHMHLHFTKQSSTFESPAPLHILLESSQK